MFSGAHGRNRRRCATLALAAAALLAVLTPAPAVAQAATIQVNKTVSLDTLGCHSLSSIEVPVEGGYVNYCYEVTNTGVVTFTSLDLVDSELGTLLQSFPYSLAPNATFVFSQTALISVATTNIATWTASITPTLAVTGTDSALVTVAEPAAGISLAKSVGTDPGVCASAGTLVLPPGGGTVYYCYEVWNTGNVTLTIHDLVDDQLGALLTSFPYTLAPGASTFITQAATITATTVNSATWTAFDVAGLPATANGQALVEIGSINIPALSPTILLALALLLCAVGLVALRRLS